MDVGPAAAVPANAALYIDGTVKPTGQAQTDAKAALSKVLEHRRSGRQDRLADRGSRSPHGHPFNYQQDVAPWLGEKAGFFFTDLARQRAEGRRRDRDHQPGGVARLRPQGHRARRRPVRRQQTYNGASYQTDPTTRANVFGTVGDFLVRATSTGFKAAVDAQKGDSLGDDSDFKDSLDQLPSDRLGTFYTVPKTLIDAIGPARSTSRAGQRSRRAPASRSTSRSPVP